MVEQEYENIGKVNFDLSFLNDSVNKENNKMKLVLIILNRPLEIQRISHLAKKADMIICADGGANHYYLALTQIQKEIDSGERKSEE